MKFFAYGHPNVLATHKTTLEFTKDSDLTKRGNCILGVNCDFDLDELKEVLKFKRLSMKITVKGLSNEFIFNSNSQFSNPHEMVIRKTPFLSDRTFGIYSDKAAKDISRELVELMRSPDTKMEVVIENAEAI